MQTAKVQTSLHIHKVLPETMLLAHVSTGQLETTKELAKGKAFALKKLI